MSLQRNSLIYIGVAIVVAGLTFQVGYYYLTRGVKVSVNNKSNDELKDIELIYTGGTEHIKELKPNATYETRVNPTSESHLNLNWTDPMGQKHFDRIDVYMESDYRGNVSITINPDYTISWVDNIKLAW